MFKDLDVPDADELFLKAKLGFEVFQIIEGRQLTAAEAAKILGVNYPLLKQGGPVRTRQTAIAGSGSSGPNALLGLFLVS